MDTFLNHDIFSVSCGLLTWVPLYLCVAFRLEGIFSIFPVLGSLSSLPNLLKTCFLVLDLYLSVSVSAQDICKNINIILKLVRLAAKL